MILSRQITRWPAIAQSGLTWLLALALAGCLPGSAPSAGEAPPVAALSQDVPEEVPDAPNTSEFLDTAPSILDPSEPAAPAEPGEPPFFDYDPDKLLLGPGQTFVALDNPLILSPAEATYLSPADAVLGLAWSGEARAYPLRMVYWHHIVNDMVGGSPALVTY